MLLTLLALLAIDSTETLRIPVAAGETLSVTITGEGPDVIMLPALFGSSFGYRHVVRLLDSAGFRAVSIEMLGMGSSDKPKDADYSLMAQSQRVAAVLDSLGIREAIFVGHSIAASVAMRVAYQHRDRVIGIVSVEGGPSESAATVGFRRLLRFAPALRMSGALRGLPALVRREMKSVSYDDSWISREIIREYTGGLMRDLGQTMNGFQGMARSEEPAALKDYLEFIDCPVVLLVGDKKHKSGPSKDEVSMLVERLPSFAVDTIPESGYFIQEEQPQAVADAIFRMSRQ